MSPPPPQSTQVGLHPQGVRLLRSSAVPQASSDVFAFPPSACPLEQNFTVDDVNTPKVGPAAFSGCILSVLTVLKLPPYEPLSTCQGAAEPLPDAQRSRQRQGSRPSSVYPNPRRPG